LNVLEELMNPWLVFSSRFPTTVDKEEDGWRKRGVNRLALSEHVDRKPSYNKNLFDY
jgi:hypothetical protein